eukprot:8770144-Heterocapsa_arctica.AAC.1
MGNCCIDPARRITASSWPRWGASSARAPLRGCHPALIWLHRSSARCSPPAMPCRPPFGSRRP